MKSILVVTFLGLLFAATAGRELRQTSVSVSASARSDGGGITTTTSDVQISPAFVEASEESAPTEPAQPPLLDIYFLVDLTETSTSFIAELAAGASIIVDEAFALTETVYLGVGTYQDTPDGSSFTHLVNVSGALDATESTLSSLSAIAADEEEEFQFFALEEVATNETFGFRPDSTRIIVWIGNAPASDPVEGITEQIVIDALLAQGSMIVAIDTGDLNAQEQVTRILQATGGILFGANDDGDFTSVGVATSTPEASASASGSASGDITSVATSVDGVDVSATTATTLIESIVQGITELYLA